MTSTSPEAMDRLPTPDSRYRPATARPTPIQVRALVLRPRKMPSTGTNTT